MQKETLERPEFEQLLNQKEVVAIELLDKEDSQQDLNRNTQLAAPVSLAKEERKLEEPSPHSDFGWISDLKEEKSESHQFQSLKNEGNRVIFRLVPEL